MTRMCSFFFVAVVLPGLVLSAALLSAAQAAGGVTDTRNLEQPTVAGSQIVRGDSRSPSGDGDWGPPVALPASDTAIRNGVNRSLLNLPLRFIANAGQTDPSVWFTVKGAGHTLFFTSKEVIFASGGRAGNRETIPSFGRKGATEEGVLEDAAIRNPLKREIPKPPKEGDSEIRDSVIRLRFPGANPRPSVQGREPLPGAVNYFLGNDPARWRVNVPTYGAVAYRNLYPGVDLIYRGTEGHLKSEFVLAPGVDPAIIQMAYSGLEDVYLREDGALALEPKAPCGQTPLGKLIEQAPLIYQEMDGVKQIIPGGYVLLSPDLTHRELSAPGFACPGGQAREDLSSLEYRVSFKVGDYDLARPLVIDPAIVYSTYLGGTTDEDKAYGIAVDSAGNAYVTGYTESTDFPTRNPLQAKQGATDVFVTQIISTSGVYTYGYSTYLGGSDVDVGYSIAVDSAGNAYVTGRTESSDFPTRNAIQSSYAYTADVFVTQIISASGAYTLGYSTYLGGGGQDEGRGIAVDEAGNAYVVGYTQSSDFPTYKALSTTLGGASDAFVTQIISASGFYTYGYSTYLGGSDLDEGYGIAVDSAGNAYVTGYTGSSDWPTRNAIQTSHGGGSRDAFVTQIISASGMYTDGYSTYLGGSSWDEGLGIAVDSEGNAYVVGDTSSTSFPTYKAIQASYGGSYDAFVTQIISASGVYTYGYSTFLGGNGDDRGYDIIVDSAGNASVTGMTDSNDWPTRYAIQSDYGGAPYDAFVTQIISASGVYTYGYSTYLGGGMDDWGYGIALDNAGSVYIAGSTQSTDFPTTTNAIQSNYGGGTSDAFVVKISTRADLSINKTITPTGVLMPGRAITYTLVYTNDSRVAAIDVVITDVVPMTLTNVSFASSGAPITPTGDISYTWRITDLAPGQGGIITITGIVSPWASGLSTLTNQATITATGAYYADENPGNNISVVTNTVDARPPIPPTLVSPANGAVISDTTPTLIWQASPSPEVIGYRLDWNGVISNVGNVTQYTLTVLADDTYTWTVATHNVLSNTSPYTDVWSLTVDTIAPVTPTLVSPENSAIISDATPTLTWQASPDAVGYLLDWNGVISDVGNVTQYTLTVLADGAYTWTVAAYDVPRNTSPYTDVWSLTVDTTPPATPTLVSPANGIAISDATPSLAWQASPGAAGYWLDWNGVISDVGNVTEYTVTLLADGTYTWTIAAYDNLSNTSLYTDVWSFTVDTVPPAPPVLIRPANGGVISDTTPTLTWQASPGAAGYRLNWNGVISDVGSVTEYTVIALVETDYTWMVAAYDELRNTSAYTEEWLFTVDTTPPAAPTLVSPVNGAVISNTTPTLTWQPSPGAEGYLLDWNGVIADVGNATERTIDILADGAYTWTVAAYDQVRNTSPYTDVWSLTVDTTPPATPTLVSPANGIAISDATPSLVWQASPGAAGYWLDWNGVIFDVGNLTEYTVTLLADGTYTWTVAAYDDLRNTSLYTDVWSFTVDTVPPAPPVLISPANGGVVSDTTPTLTWQVSPGAAGYRVNWNGVISDVGNVTQYIVNVGVDGAYTWTVAAYDALYTSPYTNVWSFTVDSTPPAPPMLISPANGAFISSATPVLTWQASLSATGYWLKWDSTVIDVGNATTYAVGAATNGMHTWTVAAYDEVRNTSAYTVAWSFTVDTQPPAIVATVPASAAVEVGITASVVITFSEAINASAFAYTITPDPGGWVAAWSNDGTVVTLAHNPFGYRTTYTVTITAASDLAGNSLAGAPRAWRFTTRSYRVYLPAIQKQNVH